VNANDCNAVISIYSFSATGDGLVGNGRIQQHDRFSPCVEKKQIVNK